jgi:[NiFe] hydrogenase assembly HybE family chaperone
MNASEIAERLAAIYRDIHRRSMRDAPICNDALEVEAIGFRTFGDLALGVMVTPWFANLVAAPQGESAPPLDAALLRLRFPAGEAEFTVSVLDGFGPLASCSLFSPMEAFTDQAAARAAAEAALAALFDPHLHDAPPAEHAAEPLDRRAFFGRRRRDESEGAAP